MMKRTKLCTSLMIAFGSGIAAIPAVAQQTLERVEITGSAIRRIDAETAVPVTILRIEELRRQGITTVEEVMQNISAVQLQQGTSRAIGTGSGGAALADARGIGANKTLVLLNGRRIANNAIDGASPDLNVIPFAALQRVEVLRDGASSLYGTDAIGGVINFITRRDYTGGTITLGFDHPEENGGKGFNVNAGAGFGDLNRDRFNVFGFFDYKKQEPIGGLDRPFNARTPGGLSPTTFPANYFQGGDTGNPAAQLPGGCSATPGLIPSADGTGCQITTSSFVDYIPRSERYSGMLKGTLKLADSTNLGLEYFGAKSEVRTRIAPVPYGGLRQNRVLNDGSLNPFYPGNPGSSVPNPNIPLDPNFVAPNAIPGSAGPVPGVNPGFVNVRFRDFVNGQRVGTTANYQHRLIGSLDGAVAGWDYNAAVFYNQNRVKDYISGYSDGPTITEGVLNGVVNPFGPQSAAGSALLAGAGRAGLIVTGKGTVTGVDARVSRELGDWLRAGRPAAVALGIEGRREDFTTSANRAFAELVVASTGIDPNTLSEGSRNVYAGYAELNVPITSQLDITAAIRYDKYSDFGNTTNPKISFRYQPTRQLLFRGAASTGFRAPSLYELNAAQTYTNTATFNDPIRCPGGVPIDGAPAATNCEVQFLTLQGGNLSLEPEESKQFSLGFQVEPVRDLSFGMDYFWIKVDRQIGAVPVSAVFGDPATFAGYFFRLPDGSLATDGSACPNPATCGYIEGRNQNLGNLKTSGLDMNVAYRLPATAAGNFTFSGNATYLIDYEYQDFISGPYNRNVGRFVGVGPIFRWQSYGAVAWNRGSLGAALVARYKAGYADYDPSNRVSSYTVFDAYGTWSPSPRVQLTLGIRNLFDRDPPFSNQQETFQANYDPRFSDPTGRTFYVRGTLSF